MNLVWLLLFSSVTLIAADPPQCVCPPPDTTASTFAPTMESTVVTEEPIPVSTEPPTPTEEPVVTEESESTTTTEESSSTQSSELTDLVTRELWEQLFPDRWGVGEAWKAEYSQLQIQRTQMFVDQHSYDNFIGALSLACQNPDYCRFLNEPGTTKVERLRELAAFLANIGHETSKGTMALYYREELMFERYPHWGTPGHWYRDTGSLHYPMPEPTGPVQTDRYYPFPTYSYHGRGPLQLSWGYNYVMFARDVYNDPGKFMAEPHALIYDGKIGFAAAIWFWMTSGCHDIMYKKSGQTPWGFGRTIMYINGGLEANAGEGEQTQAGQKVTRRISFYRQFAGMFGVEIGVDGEQLDTKGMWPRW